MVFEAPPSLVVPSYNFWGLCRLSCNSNGVEGPGEVLELVPSGNTKVASYNDNANPVANFWYVPRQTAVENRLKSS